MASTTLDHARAAPLAPRWQLPLLEQATMVGGAAGADTDLEQSLAASLQARVAELARLESGLAAATEAAASEARALGYDDGRAAGVAAAAADYVRECAERAGAWSVLETALQQRLTSLDASLDASIHAFVLELGSIVLHAELAISGAPLQRLIDEALAGLREDLRGATLLLHPEDLRLLPARNLNARADASLRRGELRLCTVTGEIEVSLPARIEAALTALRHSES